MCVGGGGGLISPTCFKDLLLRPIDPSKLHIHFSYSALPRTVHSCVLVGNRCDLYYMNLFFIVVRSTRENLTVTDHAMQLCLDREVSDAEGLSPTSTSTKGKFIHKEPNSIDNMMKITVTTVQNGYS